MSVTADPNLKAQERSTTLNFAANGQPLKSVRAVQQGIPFFASILPNIRSGNTDGAQLSFEMTQMEFHYNGGEGGCPQEHLGCNITNYPYDNLSEIEFSVYVACRIDVLGSDFELYWQYSPDGGTNWITEIFGLEMGDDYYELWSSFTQSFEINQLPNPNLMIRIGYGDKGSESIDVWLKQFQISFFFKPTTIT